MGASNFTKDIDAGTGGVHFIGLGVPFGNERGKERLDCLIVSARCLKKCDDSLIKAKAIFRIAHHHFTLFIRFPKSDRGLSFREIGAERFDRCVEFARLPKIGRRLFHPSDGKLVVVKVGRHVGYEGKKAKLAQGDQSFLWFHFEKSCGERPGPVEIGLEWETNLMFSEEGSHSRKEVRIVLWKNISHPDVRFPGEAISLLSGR